MKRVVVALLACSAVAHADKPATVNSERGTTSAPITKEEDEPPKLSLATEADRVAWTRPGFRLALGLVYGRMIGLRGTPSGRLLGAVLHTGLRLDKDWSISASLEYASASQHLGLSGLRFAGTIDPTWHVNDHLALAIGFGFAGIVEGNTGRPDVMPVNSDVGASGSSYTFGSSNPPLPSCSGVGAAALARATYGWVLGPRGTTAVELEVFGQYTACIDRTGVVEPDTAQPIVREQYWPHTGVTLAWTFAWR
jgi:hypothetical protein